MTRYHVAKAALVATILAMVGAAAYAHAAVVNQVLGLSILAGTSLSGMLPPGPSAPALASNCAAPSITPSIPASSTVQAPEPAPAPVAVQPSEAPDCNDGSRVTIVAASRKTDESFAAIIESGRSNARLKRLGDRVGDRVLVHVGSDRVWLKGEDGLCQVGMAKQPTARPAPVPSQVSSAQPTKPSAVPADIASGIKRLGPGEIEVSSQVRDRLFEKPEDLMRTRIVPEQVNGATVGIRVFNVRPDSVLGMLGLENGDRLDSINGFAISDPQKALEAYARLRLAEQYSVVVNRGGSPMNLDIRVR